MILASFENECENLGKCMPQYLKTEIDRRNFLVGLSSLGTATVVNPPMAISQDGSILQIGISESINSLDPAHYQSYSEGIVINTIFSGLVGLASGNEWIRMPILVESIDQIDATTIQFKLRDNIKLTSQDVKYSYERVINDTAHSWEWYALKKIEILDKLRGLIHLKTPDVSFLNTILTLPSGVILSQSEVEEHGEINYEYTQHSKYIIDSWSPEERIILKRNPDWVYESGQFDEIHIVPIWNQEDVMNRFNSREIDFIQLNTSNYLQSVTLSDVNIVRKPRLAFVWLGINQSNPPFDNPKIRRVIQYAINRKKVVEEAYYGIANIATGVIPPGLIGYRPSNIYNFNQELARKLLIEEEVSNLSITLDTPQTDEWVTAAHVIQSNLADVGISCTIRQHNSEIFWRLGSNQTYNLQLFLKGQYMLPDPSSATRIFSQREIGSSNWEHFNSEEFVKLHDQGLAELDPQTRNIIYRKMQDLMEESGCFYFLTNDVTTLLHRDTIIPSLKPNGEPILSAFKTSR